MKACGLTNGYGPRFFKTRALAREMVSGGKVHLEGHRVKPGREVKAGDHLSITRGEEVFEITVSVASNRRGSASEAKQLFSEEEASVLRREHVAQQGGLGAGLVGVRHLFRRRFVVALDLRVLEVDDGRHHQADGFRRFCRSAARRGRIDPRVGDVVDQAHSAAE